LLKQQNRQWQLDWADAAQPLFCGSDSVTVQQWLEQVHGAARYIAGKNGDKVMLFQRDCLQFSVWFIALCLQRKHIVLAPDDQPDTLRQAAAHCDWQLTGPLPAVASALPRCQTLTLPDEAAVSFFTSGSTGQPKLIDKTLAQLLLEVQTLETQFGQQLPADVLFCGTVSTQHIYGLLFRLLWPLCSGRQLQREQISYLEQWQAVLQRQHCVFVASPAHLARFDDVQQLQPFAVNCRRIFSSGGPLADAVPPRYLAVFAQAPTEVFGSTETGGIAFRQRHDNCHSWRAFPGIVLSQTAEQALQLTSPYLGHNKPFVTQDKVTLLNATEFELLGRLDRIVKVEEKRLSLPELEQFCLLSGFIAQAAAVVLQQGKTQLALVLVLTDAGQQFLQDSGKLALNLRIKQHLLQRFEPVLLPRKFRYVSALPYNPQGKLVQQQLEALF
jgi:acyl-coenzyme A synthetase/AMP-(fatty) acid ligase